MRIDTSKLPYPLVPGSELYELHQKIEVLAAEVREREQIAGELREERAAAERTFRRKQYAVGQMSLADRDQLLETIKVIEARQADSLKALQPINDHLQDLLDRFWMAYNTYARTRATDQARRLGGG